MKTVLITGTTSGFGFKMAQDFLGMGWHVFATLRDMETKKRHLKELMDLFPDRLTLLELDITKTEDIQNTKKYIENYLSENKENKLDMLINNAGFAVYGALEDTSMEQIRYQMDVNFFGPTELIKNLLPSIRKSKTKIVNISSIMGIYSCPLASVYSASKYALEGLSEGLVYELSSFGISVCTVRPGGHRTDFFKSINWGELSFSDTSEYTQMSSGFKNMMDKLSARKKAPGADRVSNVVLDLAKMKSMPRSVLVGVDAKFLRCLQIILPASVYKLVLVMANKVIFGR